MISLSRQKHKKYFNIFLFLLFIVFINTGCSPSGPVQPIESVNKIESSDLKNIIYGLYKKPEKVLTSLEKISQMGGTAVPAIPYLVTMLTDKRLTKKKNYGFAKTVPIFKQAAHTLGDIGEEGIIGLVDALKTTHEHTGIDDDFIREAVAAGLKRGREKWGDSVLKKMKGSNRVNHIIMAVSACLELSEAPGRFNSSDPRDSLKYYKHFLPLQTRENLKIYIETLGVIGDKKALPVLSGIVSIKSGKPPQDLVSKLTQFQRASALAQYYIKPVDLNMINPRIAEYLFIEFVVQGKTALVSKMLKEGMNPDIQTITQEPVVSLAFQKKHIDIYHLLIKSGANLNMKMSRNNTLLIRAAEKGDFLFAEQLIKSGADVALRNNAGDTALDVSLISLLDFWDGRSTNDEAEPYLKIINLLKKAGAPKVNKTVLKSIDKKAMKILAL